MHSVKVAERVEGPVACAACTTSGYGRGRRRPSHPDVIIATVTDEPTPEALEQLARSVAMSGRLGDRDRQDIIDALRKMSAVEAAKRRHPSGRY